MENNSIFELEDKKDRLHQEKKNMKAEKLDCQLCYFFLHLSDSKDILIIRNKILSLNNVNVNANGLKNTVRYATGSDKISARLLKLGAATGTC